MNASDIFFFNILGKWLPIFVPTECSCHFTQPAKRLEMGKSCPPQELGHLPFSFASQTQREKNNKVRIDAVTRASKSSAAPAVNNYHHLQDGQKEA